MPIFLLVRHGENDFVKKGLLAGRLDDVHLNENGKKQAEALADKLAKATISAIYSSPLERALETALPISERLNQKIQVREGLVEVDIGEWQGDKINRLKRQKTWKLVQSLPSMMKFPGGESFFQAQTRIVQELDDLSTHHDRKEIVLCVSHSDPIKLAVAYYIGLPLDFFQRLQVAPGSITGLVIEQTGSRLLMLNDGLSFNLP